MWKTYVAMGYLFREMRQPAHAQEFYQGARDVIYRIKVTLHNSELRTSLEQSLLTQAIYELSTSGWEFILQRQTVWHGCVPGSSSLCLPALVCANGFPHFAISREQLLALLNSPDPQQRLSAATSLGIRREIAAVGAL